MLTDDEVDAFLADLFTRTTQACDSGIDTQDWERICYRAGVATAEQQLDEARRLLLAATGFVLIGGGPLPLREAIDAFLAAHGATQAEKGAGTHP